MRTLILISAFLCSCLVPAEGKTQTNCTLNTVSDLRTQIDQGSVGRCFDVECLLTKHHHANSAPFYVMDSNAVATLYNDSTLPSSALRIGDRIRVSGSIVRRIWSSKAESVIGSCTNLTILSHNALPQPPAISLRDLANRTADLRPVRTEGVIVDVRTDDIHAMWTTLILEDNDEKGFVVLERQGDRPFDFSRIQGARVSVIGIHCPATESLRKTVTNVILIDSAGMISVLSPAPSDDTPSCNVENFSFLKAENLHSTTRCEASGHVIAVWNADNILIKTASGNLVKGELSTQPPPSYGDNIRLVGIPETDLYLPMLVRAKWHPLPHTPFEEQAAVDVTSETLQTDDFGSQQFNFRFHGKPVRIRGKVRNMPVRGKARIFYIENAGRMILVDTTETASALHDIGVDYVVEVTGICIMDTEKMTFNRIFPKINGYRIVVRRPKDIRIIETPPWWTTERLFALVVSLLAIVLGVALWNITLHSTVARRSKQLEAEITSNIESQLKVYERTRLAVELHDSLAQNLTGVAMELRTAGIILQSRPQDIVRHLDVATRSIDSCREELRNCIWDLHNLTLDDDDVNNAIRKTVEPHIGNARVAIRFCVPRKRLSDNTAHSIFSILRELSINAVRHGNATAIKIAGSIENDKLLFSVADNGQGFDPDRIPGMAQGHFGIQGIRDRLKSFDGEMSIRSELGKGCKVSISLNVPQPDEERLS